MSGDWPATALRRLVLLLRVMAVAVWVQWLVRFRQLPDIVGLIETRPRRTAGPAYVETLVATIARVVDMPWFVIRRNCYKKGLLFYYFLVTAGVPNVALHVGVKKPDGRMEGHCWLTLDGAVFQDSESNVAAYTVMYSREVRT